MNRTNEGGKNVKYNMVNLTSPADAAGYASSGTGSCQVSWYGIRWSRLL